MRTVDIRWAMNLVLTPGHNSARLIMLMQESIEQCKLDLKGSVVLTEAANGAYAVTPVLAAMAGAECVYALARETRYGTVAQVAHVTEELAAMAGVRERVKIITAKSAQIVREADIITNSGHVRPIDRKMIEQFKPTAVVPLMYEAWEYRPSDIDLDFCTIKGIPVAGTNERHPAIDVFSYLGIMAVKLLLDSGIAVYGSRVLLLCDNPFAPYIERGLKGAGADVYCARGIADAPVDLKYDAIVVALSPSTMPSLNSDDAEMIAASCEGAVVAQFWGDIQRETFEARGIPLWPSQEPLPGHMGILPSAVGPEPVVRLQGGGLKVGELLWRAKCSGLDAERAVQFSVEAGFGESIQLV
ncbi:MAG: hypothetical protein ACXVBU_07775 [Ktedonobacteraceae bacterium]